MKIISFDVGIKNLAYCLFETTPEGPPRIVDWKVLSLMDEPAPIPLCSAILPTSSKAKKQTNTAVLEQPRQTGCAHKARYTHSNISLCDKHAKAAAARGEWLLPEPRWKNVKKMKLEELLGVATSFGFSAGVDTRMKKPDILAWVEDYLGKKMLVPVNKRTAKAGEANLVSLGRAMKMVFRDTLPADIEMVLIENQISPLANRMKTVQGMLAQYFIMQYEGVGVEFISSANKLKMFVTKEDVKKKEMNEVGGGVEQTQAQKYKEHKRDGVFYCQQVLDKKVFEGGEQWTLCERKKKDDLADCFLQGVWWLKREGGMNLEYLT